MSSSFFSKSHLVPNYHFNKKITEKSALYLTHSLRQAAVGVLGIFLPIYIFIISSKFLIFTSDLIINGICWVLLYFLIRSFSVVLSVYLFGNRMFSTFNLRRSIVMSFVVLIVELTILILSEGNIFLLIPAGLLAGLNVTLYFIPFHSFFVQKMNDGTGHYGKNTGLRYAFERITSGVAPFIGGLIISIFGFPVLFVFAIALLCIASIPILYSVNEGIHRNHYIKDITKNYLTSKKYAKLTAAFIGNAFEAVVFIVFWPILIYILVKDFTNVGLMNSVAILFSIVSLYIIGMVIDKFGKNNVHKFGILSTSLGFIPKIFSNNVPLLIWLDFVDRFNSAFYIVPDMTMVYEKARRSENASDFVIYRELCIHLAIIFLAFCLIILLPLLGSWRWVFIIASIGAVLTYFLDIDTN